MGRAPSRPSPVSRPMPKACPTAPLFLVALAAAGTPLPAQSQPLLTSVPGERWQRALPAHASGPLQFLRGWPGSQFVRHGSPLIPSAPLGSGRGQEPQRAIHRRLRAFKEASTARRPAVLGRFGSLDNPSRTARIYLAGFDATKSQHRKITQPPRAAGRAFRQPVACPWNRQPSPSRILRPGHMERSPPACSTPFPPALPRGH
jgi:hypothetical protein